MVKKHFRKRKVPGEKSRQPKSLLKRRPAGESLQHSSATAVCSPVGILVIKPARGVWVKERNKFSFPGGGQKFVSETPVQTAQRELREESGVRLRAEEFILAQESMRRRNGKGGGHPFFLFLAFVRSHEARGLKHIGPITKECTHVLSWKEWDQMLNEDEKILSTHAELARLPCFQSRVARFREEAC